MRFTVPGGYWLSMSIAATDSYRIMWQTTGDYPHTFPQPVTGCPSRTTIELLLMLCNKVIFDLTISFSFFPTAPQTSKSQHWQSGIKPWQDLVLKYQTPSWLKELVKVMYWLLCLDLDVLGCPVSLVRKVISVNLYQVSCVVLRGSLKIKTSTDSVQMLRSY